MKSLLPILAALALLLALSNPKSEAMPASSLPPSGQPETQTLAWTSELFQAEAPKEGDSAEQAQPAKEDKQAEELVLDLELLDGQRLLGCKLTAITEGGVEFELAGISMQVRWDLLRPEDLVEYRKRLVDTESSRSVKSYAEWSQSMGLDEEFLWADTIYMRLNEGRSLRPQPVIEKPEPAEGTDPDKTPKDPKDPAPIEPAKQISTVINLKCDDEELRDLVKENLERAGFTVKEEGANSTFQVKPTFVLIGRSEFFGDVIFATYNLKCSINVTGANNEVIAVESIESGEMKAKSDAISKESCRTNAAALISIWARKNVQKKR